MKLMDKELVGAASDAWESYMRAYGVMTRRFQSDGSFVPVSMREYDILYALSRSSEPLTQSELMAAVVLSQPALSRMLKRLEDSGYICRSAHESDGRASVLELTERGVKTQRDIGKVHGKAVANALYGALDEGEVRTLRGLCERIIGGEGAEGRSQK